MFDRFTKSCFAVVFGASFAAGCAAENDDASFDEERLLRQS